LHTPDSAAWLRLTLTPGLGNGVRRALLREFGLPDAIFAASRARLVGVCGDAAATALLDPPHATVADLLERTDLWLRERPGACLISLADPDYPPPLLHLADPPLLLYAQGRRELLAQAAVAIVGSRNATAQGARDAAAFAAHLGRAGLCIVSGLASGIDAAAHAGALEAAAATVAVLGTGIDRVYPPRHRALSERVAREGLLLSELPLGSLPDAHHFPRRNRIIAALARGVLVVEAAPRSGSLITARLAAELGRAVMAVPGSIHSPLSRGCHQLLRDGACLVESAQDVLEELHWAKAAAAAGAAPTPAAAAHPLLAVLGSEPLDLDTLARQTGQDPGSLAAALLELELEQRVARLAGNRYVRLHG